MIFNYVVGTAILLGICIAPLFIAVLPLELFIRRYKPATLSLKLMFSYMGLYIAGIVITIYAVGDTGPFILGLMLIWIVLIAVGLSSLSRTIARAHKNRK